MAFDRKAVSTVAACEAGCTFEPRYPDGSGIGATITVCGPESKAARSQAREQLQRLQVMEANAKRTGQKADALSLALAQDIEDAARQKARTAAALTIGWHDITDGSAPLECTPENAQALYADHPWLADQVIAQSQDLGNFVKGSSKPFSNTPAPSSSST